MSHKIELDINGAGRGTVTLDGNPIHCTAIRISGRAGKLTKVTIQLLAEVSGKIEIEDLVSVERRQAVPGEDVTDTTSKWARYVTGGILTPNEARRPLEGDDEPQGVPQ